VAGDYDEGGILSPGWTVAKNDTDTPETVLTEGQWRRMGEGDPC
jgi:hypothetical protein